MEKLKRKLEKGKIIIVFFISLFVFLSGLSLGNLMTRTKVSLLDDEISKIEIGLASPELEFLFKDVMQRELSCEYFNTQLYDITQHTNTLADEITKYEKNTNPFFSQSEFNILKSRYTLALLKNWMYLEKLKKVCDSNYTTVLYFYTSDCDKCPMQGFYLSYYKKLASDDLMIFALQTDIDVAIAKAIAINYNVTVYPSLVIDGEKVYHDFQEKSDLKDIFCDNDPKLPFCS